MVYCGKPSGGCHSCRQKKTRCDQKPEGCTQCFRAKRVCPGYRVPGDIIFRNESANVIRKFKTRQAREKLISSTSPVETLSPVPLEESESSQETLELVLRSESSISCFSLATNIEDQATAYFVTNYVVNVNGPTRGHLDYLSTVFGDDGVDVGLHAGMKAVGLAGVAHRRYVKAIEATNAALKSPLHVYKDSTLASIMVLGIFETVTGCNQKSIQDWAEHVKGAAALLKVRGIKQLDTPTGRRMFIQITSSLMISCIQRGAPLPSHIVEYMQIAKSKIPEPEPAFLFQEMMMDWTILHASIRSGALSDPELIIARALELDGVFTSTFTTHLPTDWQYQTVYTDLDADCIYNGRVDIYYDHWIAQIWNAMRSMRVMLNETIRDHLLAGFSSKPPRFTAPECTAQLQTSTDICFELQADMLASVPQHLGFVSSARTSREECGGRLPLVQLPTKDFSANVPMTGPYFLMWPLWYAGVMDIATEEVQKFVVNNLRTIGKTMGIQQAVVLAKVIETKSGISAW